MDHVERNPRLRNSAVINVERRGNVLTYRNPSGRTHAGSVYHLVDYTKSGMTGLLINLIDASVRDMKLGSTNS